MAKTRGTGLLMLWTDVDPEHEAAFNRWYDEEHLARLLAVPGFLSAARYVALRGGPRYLAMYELEDVSVLRTAAFLDEVRFRPSPERQRASARPHRAQLPAERLPPDLPGAHGPDRAHDGALPYLQMGRIDVPAAIEEEFNDWYNWVYIPTYLTVPGVIRARRFVAVDAQPKYLTSTSSSAQTFRTARPGTGARESSPWSRRIPPQMRLDPGSPAVYRRLRPDPVP